MDGWMDMRPLPTRTRPCSPLVRLSLHRVLRSARNIHQSAASGLASFCPTIWRRPTKSLPARLREMCMRDPPTSAQSATSEAFSTVCRKGGGGGRLAVVHSPPPLSSHCV